MMKFRYNTLIYADSECFENRKIYIISYSEKKKCCKT